jgi:hypothetical protein
LKREARIPSISLNRSVIRMRAYAVRLLRLPRIEFSVSTASLFDTCRAIPHGPHRVVKRTLMRNFRTPNIARDSADGIVPCVWHVEHLGPHRADWSRLRWRQLVSERLCACGLCPEVRAGVIRQRRRQRSATTEMMIVIRRTFVQGLLKELQKSGRCLAGSAAETMARYRCRHLQDTMRSRFFPPDSDRLVRPRASFCSHPS